MDRIRGVRLPGAGECRPPWQRRQVQLGDGAPSDGEVAGVGLEILILDDDGRIRIDYQFIEA
jgi:hypothetical protein